jgi:hypothetical protein
MAGHECNGYCRDGRHAHLMYSVVDDAEGLARDMGLWLYRNGYRILGVERAAEAPPIAEGETVGLVIQRPGETMRHGADPAATPWAFLVFFEETTCAAR